MTLETGPELSADERAALLRLARAAIGERLFTDGRLARALAELTVTPALDRPAAHFVSLKTRGDGPRASLRGCIGVLQPRAPLHAALPETAAKAAFEDPRFPPLARHELETVTIELSVLGPLVPLGDPSEIEIGIHGVQLVCGSAHAVFLPQVAREQGWDRERLLTQLSLKAGLGELAWRSAELSAFRSVVFGEADQVPGG